jgi:hypothetical protein
MATGQENGLHHHMCHILPAQTISIKGINYSAITKSYVATQQIVHREVLFIYILCVCRLYLTLILDTCAAHLKISIL